MSSITIKNNTLLANTDFEYIWRWLFFKRIVADNEEYNKGLFTNNDDWKKFEYTISKIKAPVNKKKSIIPPKIKIAIPFKDPTSQTEISLEIEVDFQKIKDNPNYVQFISSLDKAEKEFAKLTRTDTPYYLFVDGLEAYYGNESVFFVIYI